ncbi:polymorphic toxin-type HINT domain-containing protein [Streptomyces camelliae]|uniref:Polymorphic toxin-type HINT domain-containing protein n=1 Tax=Streptomyces camelliae TaxID=3004093 RepID=A0ABY7P1C5_9ACTN|nr:polymorphic toxin-type HINT domain-containing protein [Streptomyces sp. HUAS 2-6]WBO64310.1 polymorphic toxin-type HINT domain-containing protein [Streptomyces sp. HUAS 2-6]
MSVWGGKRRASRLRRSGWVVFLAVGSLFASAGTAGADAVQRTAHHHASAPDVHAAPSVKGVKPAATHFAKPHDQATRQYRPTATTLPTPQTATLPVAAPHKSLAAAHGSPRLPLSMEQVAPKHGRYSGPSAAKVTVKSRTEAAKAGVNGVLFTLAPSGKGIGTAQLSLDYSGFAQAYGGAFGSRLHLVRLPACALTTPQRAACRTQTPLRSRNDARSKSVSTSLPLSGTSGGSSGGSSMMVMAAVSGSGGGDGGGPSGSYAATTLKPSGSWSAGGSSGSFTYSYPMAVPSSASALTPKPSLDYDSGSVDGQTAATEAQSSWVGDGWSTPQSFIEQSFVSCSDSPEGTASPVSTSDECYDGPILTLSLNGSTTSLVWDSSKSVWKPQNDNGAVVKHVTNSNNGTGTYNTDYWTVTERDGKVYSFGRNELPGWASGKATTNSVDTEPVYSAHSGDPCYNSSGFTSSVCTMAYRWNLDYVTDVQGDAMSYYYKQDTNYYGEDNGAHNVSYVRDSHLDHIDYGFTDGNAYGTVPDKVLFTTGDRCVSGTCDPLNSTTKANWPDVPYDLVCASGATCAAHSPSFFSTVRLTTVTTEQYAAASSAYAKVDSWALTQTMPTSGDGNATLWLSGIAHTGQDTAGGGSTSPITLPSVSFTAVDLQNRVDTVTDGLPPLDRFRISAVTTETGSVIGVQYAQTAACSAPVTISPASNTSSCFPVYWTPQGYSAPFLDWFNKYVANKVTQTDPTGGAPTMATSYQYAKPAWHFDDNEVVQKKYRTYGQWRGYGDVKTLTGDGVNDKQTLAETTYYQGMSDDNNTTAVSLTDSQGGSHEDLNQLAGQSLESTSYLGNGGPVDHSAITSYWVSPATATRTRSGLPDLTANAVEPVETWTRQAVTDGGTTTWRINETDTAYDATTTDADFGLQTAQYSHTVPANAAYERCTTTTYAAPNSGENLVGLVASTETDSVPCGGFTEGSTASVPGSVNTLTAPATVNRPDQVVSASRTFYDDQSMATTWPQPASPTFPQTSAPTKGDASVTQQASGYSGGAFTWQTTKSQVYDSRGRVTAAYDANGKKTATAFTDDAYGSVTGTTTTNPLNQSTTTTLDPTRGLPLTTTDANGVVTTVQFDTLGRTTSAWLDSRATTSPANYTYSYTVSNSGISATTTNKLNDSSGYQTSTTLYDALMRPRQTQTGTPQGGRLVSDTFYDTRGWKSATYNGWWDSATTPNTTLVSAANLKDEVPNQDYFSYDGLGRTLIDLSEKDNVEVSRTTTVYNGDRTTVIPPSGGVTKSTVTDPLGRTTELDEYTSTPTLNTPSNTFTGTWSVTGGTSQATTYGYDDHGNQNSVTAAGSTWTSTYDLLGRVTAKHDPDAGDSTMQYDNAGNLLQSTDSRNKTISFTYDALGRKTGEYDAPVTGQSTSNQLASWVYDNSDNAVTGMKYAIGHVTTETAYSGGAAYVTQSKGFNVFGESLGETVTIPSSTEGSTLGTSYTFQHTYTTTTGLPFRDIYPAAGGLPAETVGHTYSGALDLPSGLGSTSGYAQTTAYDAFGRVQQETIGMGSNEAWITNTYDPHTSKLTDQLVTRSTATPTNVDEQAYTYDPAGNITKQTSTRLGSTTSTETQCYQYDNLDRLTQAWTATDSCAATPSGTNSSTVGDALDTKGAYWTSWSLDALGNRTGEVQHSTTGGTDTTTTYGYNGNSTNQPHTLTSTDTTGGATASTTATYDSAGNTQTRTTPANGTQTFAWDDAGRLTGITGGTKGDSHYLYDPEGNLLLQKGPSSTTLYLPGEQLTLDTTSGTVNSNRYYTLPGGGRAVRTGSTASGSTSTYTFQIPDQHGTAGLSLDSTAQTPTWREFTPYGAPRGTTVTWSDNRGFLNAPTDTNTALSIIGARQYDPTTGRFISLDPLFEATDPQQMAGYAYAGANPVTNSDPTGMILRNSDGSECSGGWNECGPGSVDTSGVDMSGDNGCSGEGDSLPWNCYGFTPSEYGSAETDTWHGTPPPTYENDHLSDPIVVHVPVAPHDKGTSWWKSGLDLLGDAGKFIYHASGAADVVGCLKDPSWGGCTKAAFMVVLTVGTGGEDEVVMMGADALEDGAADLATSGDELMGVACKLSFSPSTRVLMAHGKTKPIAKIKPGDKVEAGNPQTGKHQGPRTVQHVWINHDHDLLDVTIRTKDGHTATVHTTAKHPFWDDTIHQWVLAGKLHRGDALNTATNGHVHVVAIRTTPGAANRWNLTVQQLHTYYVLAGATPVLVHNCKEGVATLHYHGEGNHFSIEVTDGETVTHTHLMPHDGEAVVSPYDGPPSIMSRDLDLPNAEAALKFQEETQGSWGPYHPLGNSCLTYCASVLREGGAEVPEGKAAIPWARKFLSGGE